MIKIAYLVDHPEVIPILVEWFRSQWPAYYAERTLAEIAQDFYIEANRNSIPVRLVAFADGELVGTITLREHALRDWPMYRPGLGGLFVVEHLRRRGIGSELVLGGMKVARELDHKKIYTATATADGILMRLGWKQIQAVSHGDERLNIYCCELLISN